MADTVDDDPLPSGDIQLHSKVTKTQRFLVSGDCTLMKTFINILLISSMYQLLSYLHDACS